MKTIKALIFSPIMLIAFIWEEYRLHKWVQCHGFPLGDDDLLCQWNAYAEDNWASRLLNRHFPKDR